MRIAHVLLIATFLLTAGTPAWADSKPKTHDGFHFQLTGGLGYYSVSGGEPANQDFSGMTMPGSLLLGGTLFGHLAFGGGLYLDYAPSPTYKVNGTEVPDQVSSQFILGLGLYGDYYLEPEKNGLHIQVFTGWGGLETSFQGNVGGSDPTGLVVAAGAGYEWWLTDQWSGGVLGRLVYAPISLNGTSFTTIEPAVVGTLTWH
jgi:hypothetical protein